MTHQKRPSFIVRLSLLGLFCLCFACFAAPVWASADEAGPHLNLKAGQVYTGRFVYEHPVQGLDKPLRSEGHFSIAPKDKIVWAIEKPMATTTTIADGHLVQSVGKFAILKLSPEKMPFLADVEDKLVRALSGAWGGLEKDYVISRTGDAAGWIVTMTPREKGSKPFQKIVARGGRFVENADIYLRSAVDRVIFSDQAVSMVSAAR